MRLGHVMGVPLAYARRMTRQEGAVQREMRDYAVYLLLTHDGDRPLYSWPVWRDIFPLVAPFFLHNSDETRVCAAYKDLLRGRSILQNRMTWSERTHERWTLHSPHTEGYSRRLAFVACEMWSPFPHARVRSGAYPDVVLALHRPLPRLHRGYDTALMLAVATDLPSPLVDAGLPAAMVAIGARVDTVLLARTTAPWIEMGPGRQICSVPSWSWRKPVYVATDNGGRQLILAGGPWETLASPLHMQTMQGQFTVASPAAALV